MCKKEGTKGIKEIKVNGIKIKYDKKGVSIINSYKVTIAEDMIIILRLFQLKTYYKSRRTLKSWVKEWKAHNRLYKLGLFRNHTKDCDLEENEKWWRLLAYQILGV